jgi:hypothetical protein
MKQISLLTNTRHTCCLRNLTFSTVLSYTHNKYISETTWMFSTGKRDNFIKEQLHIHVISFDKLSGEELYELLVPHVQVSLNARTKHVHLFHCLQKHTSNWPGFDTKR